MLGSLNLSEFVVEPFSINTQFDFEGFKNAIKESVIALNEVLHEGLPLHPLDEQRESVNNWRQIGTGIFGWHDCLIKLGLRYGETESLKLASQIGEILLNTAVKTSAELTDVYGQFPMYDKESLFKSKFFQENVHENIKELVAQKGLANSQLLTVAPTGSIGTMLGVSTGIEPIYDITYTRKTESLHGKDAYYKVYTPIVKEYIEIKGIENESDLPNFINTAMTLNYKERIEMQATWQQYIDASISSTVNLPESTTVKDIENLYMLAWEKGLKGVTVYRDGCERKGILSKNKTMEEKKENCLTWGTTLVATDDLIGRKKKIMTGCGSLHVQGWFDPVTGNMMELYLSKGSRGGCLSWMVSNSRIISAALRSGTNFNYIVDQLKSAPACVSYAVRTATKKDTSPGNSCPSAVANALMEMQKDIYEELFDYEEEESDVEVKTETRNMCPECGTELQYQNGCHSCSNCSWNRCE